MTRGLKIFLIAFILSLPFWWVINISQESLEEFLFQWEITRNPEILTAQAGHLILEKKLQDLKPIRKRDIEDFYLPEAEAVISVLIRPDQPAKILFEKNTDKKLPIASLVKLMTAHVVLEYYDLSISIEHLLYPLLIESSNDAAFALAEIIGQKEFVNLMNSEAERLGLKSTYFADPTGLDPNELTKPISHSTVRDLAKFAEYLLKHNLIWEILSTEKINLYGPELVNTNELLNKIPGIIGGKTGETPKAGNCLLLVSQTPGVNQDSYLINIILGSLTPESRFEEMKKLINWLNLAYEWEIKKPKTENSRLYPALLNWEEMIANASWSKRDAHASLVFQNKIWLFGGAEGGKNFNNIYGKLPHKSDIWVSENGRDWQLVIDDAPWGERRSLTMTIFKDKIWLLGGWEKQSMDHKNDVWFSEDGENWKRALSFAPWQARSGHSVIVFNNKIWLIGGVNFYKGGVKNDVWYSEDGINWSEAASNIPWSARYDQTVVVFRDKMWLMGGVGLDKQAKNDIWVSENGKDWKIVTDNAPWPKRHGHTSNVFKDRIWIISGWNTQQDKGLRDVWYSKDGYIWEKTIKDAPWTGREDHTSVVFKSKLWLIGGMDTNWTWKNDIWHSIFE